MRKCDNPFPLSDSNHSDPVTCMFHDGIVLRICQVAVVDELHVRQKPWEVALSYQVLRLFFSEILLLARIMYQIVITHASSSGFDVIHHGNHLLAFLGHREFGRVPKIAAEKNKGIVLLSKIVHLPAKSIGSSTYFFIRASDFVHIVIVDNAQPIFRSRRWFDRI